MGRRPEEKSLRFGGIARTLTMLRRQAQECIRTTHPLKLDGFNSVLEVGTAFEKDTLPSELRERIMISPLTVFEVLSQLTIANADEVLRQVHAVHNWTNPERTRLLPWPDDMLFSIWFQKPAPDDGFTKRMEKAFNPGCVRFVENLSVSGFTVVG